ncbi:PDZ domain-containing protein [Kribbella antibiotica]|uniref:PDZ domain-containing protein n=1 Tax=Kribbella antibiotica TaxID=190195 RepID=A0A4R4ZK68_9ACTN|nr:trypsin-like peptidase domain-containing protein [Kribbella antibiotica]TDD59103.1 PDZ domain-containing protein [Kribbella antibiotica]
MSTNDAEPTPPSTPPLAGLTPPVPGTGTTPLAAPRSDSAYRQTESSPQPALQQPLQPPSPNQPMPSAPTPGQPGLNQPMRSVTQRSFGAQEPTFRPVYPGQAWPTERPGYQGPVPPPPLDWHQQQARAYTPAEPPKKLDNRVIVIAAIVALIVGLLAGGGAAVTVVALNGNGPITEQPDVPVGTGTDPKIKTGSVSAVASTLLPSVVQLRVEGSDNSQSTGSGFVIDNAGHVLTNNHVVAEAAKGGSIQIISQQGKSQTARLVGRSPAYDLAVVQVIGLAAPAVQFGQSDQAIVGQDVVAIGSPLGLAGTVTSGIISAKNRPVTAGDSADQASYINALQTDAAINPGNSGGPLVDMNARVIGVNSAIAAVRGSQEGQSGNIGLGFAIPIDQARRTAQQLIANGKATFPVIGANVDMRFEGGARVSTVNAGSPAARAGLRVGDVITEINKQLVDTAEGLIVAIRSHQPGESVRLVYERSGRPRQATVTLAEQIG